MVFLKMRLQLKPTKHLSIAADATPKLRLPILSVVKSLQYITVGYPAVVIHRFRKPAFVSTILPAAHLTFDQRFTADFQSIGGLLHLTAVHDRTIAVGACIWPLYMVDKCGFCSRRTLNLILICS